MAASFITQVAVSQTIQKTIPTAKPAATIKAIPVQPPTPPPAATNKTAAGTGQAAPVYTLTAVRVLIKTGTDNKEFLSEVGASLWKKDHSGWNYPNDCCYKIAALKNEMAVNSNTNLGLDKYPGGNADKLSLANLQANGVELLVQYIPNLLFDAWKIENITLVLEFRDQNGNLHPTLGSKTISFSNAIGFLNADFRTFKCRTDQYFNPLTASIEK